MAHIQPKLIEKEAIRVTEVALTSNDVAYAMVSDQPVEYGALQSRIVYIGETGTGYWRLTSSAGERAEQLYDKKLLHPFCVRVVACDPISGVKASRKLERALLLVFREIFGSLPICNSDRSVVHEHDEFEHFSKADIKSILDSLEVGAI